MYEAKILDNRTGEIYDVEFMSRIFAEIYIHNQNQHFGKQYELIEIHQ